MAVIGYARVSTREQNPQAQAAELRAAGAEQIFTDCGESSREAARPQWVACKAQLQPEELWSSAPWIAWQVKSGWPLRLSVSWGSAA
ncbi:recombinase family protein [Glutamicibacter sp. FR1]|nr:recombinase family protein [Glutamicibacter nicotianae]